MKVKSKTPVFYNGQRFEVGEEFEITKTDFEQHKGILEVTEGDKVLEKTLTDLTYVELKEMAKEKNIEGYAKMKKDELIAALEALEADANGGSGDTGSPPAETATEQK